MRGFEETVEVKESANLDSVVEKLDLVIEKLVAIISALTGDEDTKIEETIETGGDEE